MANLLTRSVLTVPGLDTIVYAIKDPAGVPVEGKMALSELASLYATATQGATADTAVQPGDLATVAFTGAYANLSGTPTLGTIASQNANNVTITGGSIVGITDLAIADGGTGASDASGARSNLGLGTLAVINSPLPIANGGSGQTSQQAAIDALTAVAGATNEHVLTKDTGTGNAIWKAAAGGGAVSSVFTRTGAVVAANGDYTASQVTNVAAGNIAGVTVQAALNELDGEKAGLALANVFTAAPQKVNVNADVLVHAQRASPGNSVILINGAAGTEARLEMSENTTYPFTRGGYVAYGNGINPTFPSLRVLEFGTRLDSTTDLAGITIGAVGASVFIGIQEGAPTSTTRVIGIGRRSAPAHSDAVVIGVGSTVDLTSPASNTITLGLNSNRLLVATSTGVGFGTDTPGAKIHGDQASTTGAIPVLTLDQADVDEDFISFIGDSSASTADRSLVKPSDFPTPGAIVAWLKCKITDNRVGGIGTIDAWIPAYATPTV